MKLTYSIISFFLVLSFNQIFSQNVYVVGNNNFIYLLNSSNTLEYVYTIDTGIVTGDIAISSSGTIYGLKNGFLPNPEIIEIDIVNGTNNVIGTVPVPTDSFSMVCNNNDELFVLGSNNELWKFNINSHQSTFIDNLGSSSPGDITFYKGNLIFQSTDGGNIKAYNLSNGNISTILCKDEPLNDNLIWGISNVYTNCGNEIIVASDYANNFYELDIESNSINLLNIDISILPQNVQINGMASTSEHFASLCNSIQLPNVECSLSIDEFSLLNDESIFYPNPFNDNVQINLNTEIELVEIYDLNGRLINKFICPNYSIPTADLPSGVYFLKASYQSVTVTKKMIKK